MSTAVARRTSLPGFGLTMGLTLTWLSVIILIPLAGLFLKTLELSPVQFWEILTSRRTLNALKLSFGLSFAAACVNLVMGTIIVWALVRYRFPGRRLFDAIVDIPFALPTAVAGVALTQLFAQKGWLGAPLAELGIKVAFTPIGIFIAMVFIGIPFVVRTVQPVLIDLDPEIEEAAASLGANRWHTVFRVILPSLIPALLTGFALAFARAVGEYGSVIFIAGNLPNVSEIAPLLIVIRLSEFRYADATSIAVIMLVVYVGILALGLTEFRRTPVGFIPQIDRGILILALYLVSSIICLAQPKLIDQVSQLELKGQFKEASTLLHSSLQSKSLPAPERKKLEFELDRLDRIKKDFPSTKEELFADLKKSVVNEPAGVVTVVDVVELLGLAP